MKISELRIGQDKAEIEADVLEVTEPREFNKFGRNITVATATLQDESGTIKMSLWNQDIDKVAAGSRIKVTNGYVKEFQGEKQLTAGKFGKIEVLGKSEGKSEKAAGVKSKKKEESEEVEEGFEEEELEENEEF
jgi:replication factor A1